MSDVRKYLRNLAANWIGYWANLVVVFFLFPFVMHSLGEVGYGVWSLLVSLTGYLGLVEIGTRAGLGRHITFYLGKNDIPKVNAFLNTAMVIFLAAGVVLLIAASLLGMFFPVLFSKVPPELVGSAQMAIFLTALNLWLSFFSAAFTQILVAHERFDLSNAVNLAVLVVRTVGTVAALKMGGGIVELAAVQAASSIVGVAACGLLARHIMPQMRLNLRLASRAHFRELFGFSIWAAVCGIAGQLLYWSDTVIIAIFLGPAMVAFYAVASMLAINAREVINQCSNVFVPEVIKHCARKDWHSLRWLLLNASNVVMAVAIPMFIGLIVFGREFIVLWMGKEFLIAYPVLIILSAVQFPAVAMSVASAIYAGLDKMRLGAILGIAQATLNVVLSIWLLAGWKLGLVGIAWGAVIPRAVFPFIAGGLALAWVGLPLRKFLVQLVPRWIVLAAAIAGACVAVNAWAVPPGWLWFFVKVTAIAIISMLLAFVIALDGKQRSKVRTSFIALLVKPARGVDSK